MYWLKKHIIIKISGTIHLHEEDVMFMMSRAWDKEKSEFPTGIEPMTHRTLVGSDHLAMRDSWCIRPYTGFMYDTRRASW